MCIYDNCVNSSSLSLAERFSEYPEGDERNTKKWRAQEREEEEEKYTDLIKRLAHAWTTCIRCTQTGNAHVYASARMHPYAAVPSNSLPETTRPLRALSLPRSGGRGPANAGQGKCRNMCDSCHFLDTHEPGTRTTDVVKIINGSSHVNTDNKEHLIKRPATYKHTAAWLTKAER